MGGRNVSLSLTAKGVNHQRIQKGRVSPLTTNVSHHVEISQYKSIEWFLYDWELWSLMG